MRLLMVGLGQEMGAALRFLLSQEPDICVVGESRNSQELLACLEVVRPDAVLLDRDLPGMPMAELLAELRARDANLGVLILCFNPERERVAVAAGARAFVDRTSHPRQLLTALRVLQLESDYE